MRRKLSSQEEWLNPKGWAEAFIPGLLPYNYLRENRERFEAYTTKGKIILYTSIVASEIVLDVARAGVSFLVYKWYF